MGLQSFLHLGIQKETRHDDNENGLADDYHRLIAMHLAKIGLKEPDVRLEVRRFGAASNGFDVFICMVKLSRLNERHLERVLLGIPAIEQRIGKAVRATWLADYSHFAGLWFHASESMAAEPQAEASKFHLHRCVPQAHPV